MTKTAVVKGHPHIPEDANLDCFLFFVGRSALQPEAGVCGRRTI